MQPKGVNLTVATARQPHDPLGLWTRSPTWTQPLNPCMAARVSTPLPGKVLVVGATGQTGKMLVKELLENGSNAVEKVRKCFEALPAESPPSHCVIHIHPSNSVLFRTHCRLNRQLSSWSHTATAGCPPTRVRTRPSSPRCKPRGPSCRRQGRPRSAASTRSLCTSGHRGGRSASKRSKSSRCVHSFIHQSINQSINQSIAQIPAFLVQLSINS